MPLDVTLIGFRAAWFRAVELPPASARCPRSGSPSGRIRLARGTLIGVTPGDRAGRGRRVLADPLVLPGRAVLLRVTARPVDRCELAADLLAVRPAAAGHLVGADVHLPAGACPPYPAVRPRVPEREALSGQVIAVVHVDDRVPLRPGIGIRLVGDHVDGRRRRRSPPAEQPRALERVPGQRAEPDHGPSNG